MGTPNPRIFAICKRCGFEREHYTRKRGTTKVSPCVMCMRAMTRERAEAKAEDPAWVERRRAQYRRYNASPKGQARSKRARQGPEPSGDSDASDEISEG